MTPEQTAKEIVEKYKDSITMNVPVYVDWLKDGDEWYETIREAAIIHVQGIIDSNPISPNPNHAESLYDKVTDSKNYWQQVLTQIQNQ